MQRFELVRAENQTLREANGAIRSNLDTVEQLLEGVLAIGSLPEEAHSLAKEAESVMACKMKLS